ncbi:DUF7686 domain-containing protein [Paraburkholderia xenovorans]
MLDVHGHEHEFQFRSLLLGNQLSLGAFELAGDDDPAGYRFLCLSDPESEPFALSAERVQKIKRALTRGCGQNLGPLGGSPWIHTKTAFERSSCS